MKRFVRAAAALLAAPAATLLAAPAFAGVVTLDFETVPSFTAIGNSYAAFGISFGGDALGLQNDGTGSGVNGAFFSHAPSPLGVMAVVGADATMNMAGGFHGLSFFYASADPVANAVQVWSGIDGTGALLQSFNFSANAGQGCTDSAFCHWNLLSSSFIGTARSVTFAGAIGQGIDNVTVVPEPSSALLAGLGLVGLLVLHRRD